jgi:tRNA pseudouridine55 synthase
VLLTLNTTSTAPRAKIVRRAVHGVLLLDKPLGLSSNDALQKAKRLYRAEKAGHTGTLDPLATGLLPLCFGAATKFSQVSLDADKRYLATLQLGVATTTGDAEGQVLTTQPVDVTREQMRAACAALTGPVKQLPPMYSALKKDGKPLYEYARQGIEVERKARAVTIHQIDIVEGDTSVWVLDVRCSKGTYIRTLAEDIGKHLGCGAHLKALRRIGSGTLSIEQSHSLEQLAAMSEQERDAALMPADGLLADWPEVLLNDEDAGRFLCGMRRRLSSIDGPLVDATHVRVYGPPAHTFLGTGHVTAGELISTRLLSPLEVQSLHNPHPNTKTAESST